MHVTQCNYRENEESISWEEQNNCNQNALQSSHVRTYAHDCVWEKVIVRSQNSVLVLKLQSSYVRTSAYDCVWEKVIVRSQNSILRILDTICTRFVRAFHNRMNDLPAFKRSTPLRWARSPHRAHLSVQPTYQRPYILHDKQGQTRPS